MTLRTRLTFKWHDTVSTRTGHSLQHIESNHCTTMFYVYKRGILWCWLRLLIKLWRRGLLSLNIFSLFSGIVKKRTQKFLIWPNPQKLSLVTVVVHTLWCLPNLTHMLNILSDLSPHMGVFRVKSSQVKCAFFPARRSSSWMQTTRGRNESVQVKLSERAGRTVETRIFCFCVANY